MNSVLLAIVVKFVIPLLVTTLGVLLALLCQHKLEKGNKEKQNKDILITLKNEFLRNVTIAKKVIKNTNSEDDLKPYSYSENVWDALIGSGIIFNCKLEGISDLQLSRVYTRIKYGNFVEDIITDIYIYERQCKKNR